jgi:hypothetical protein
LSEPARRQRGPRLRARLALALLVLAAAAQYGWNAWNVPAVVGYDVGGHAGYVLAIAREGRLPHPLSGWSTFHPPAWHLLAAALWRAIEPFGPEALRVALRALGGLAWLAAGVALHRALCRSAARADTAWAATALFFFVPVNQMACAMIGNEAFAAACSAAAIPFLLRLQAAPGDLRAAAAAGLAAGLALATKYTGVWVAAACAVPFARRDLGRREARALATCALVAAAIAAPTYLRNLALLGSPFPMTRTLQPMQTAEADLTMRVRWPTDYVWIPADCLRRPSVHQQPGKPGALANRNPSMQSVPCIVYAGLWYDPFAQRVPLVHHHDGEWLGPLLLALGAAPTALLLAGLALAARECVRTRGRSRDAPLVVMTAVASASFVAFTWRAPSLAAAKASYLMPLAGASAFFFARGAEALPDRLRGLGLSASLVGALAAAVVFTSGVLFPPDPDRALVDGAVWHRIGALLPASRISEASGILWGPPAIVPYQTPLGGVRPPGAGIRLPTRRSQPAVAGRRRGPRAAAGPLRADARGVPSRARPGSGSRRGRWDRFPRRSRPGRRTGRRRCRRAAGS